MKLWLVTDKDHAAAVRADSGVEALNLASTDWPLYPGWEATTVELTANGPEGVLLENAPTL